ncbi:MAG: hypothetical protein RLZZ28_802 [Bacteroidota bacterium]
MKKLLHSFLLTAAWISQILIWQGCANILPPGGGLKDTLPPRLLMALPKDSAVNVNTRNIVLTFDEYISLQNPLENLIISPVSASNPLIDYKLKNISIKLKDSLEPNTTYSFDFGESIRDVNEGNTARGLRYVFSTGKTIDNYSYRGKVLLAETGKTDSSKIIVLLHKNLSDTAVIKNQPRYYTRINGKGEFAFYNLPRGEFAVYALEKGFSKKYDDSTRLFGFKNSPVLINENTPADTLYAFEEVKRKDSKSTGGAVLSPGNKDDKRLRYTIDLDAGMQDILSNLHISFLKKLGSFDSSKFVLTDTNYHPLTGYHFVLDSSKTKISLNHPWKENSAYRLLIAKDAVADSLGTTLAKADTVRFFTRKESEYGSIRIIFTNLDIAKNPVLQIVQTEKILESFPLRNSDFRKKLFKPGAYEIRILYDANKNGVWDSGKFMGHKKQPEIVVQIPKQLAIKANWDNELTIVL